MRRSFQPLRITTLADDAIKIYNDLIISLSNVSLFGILALRRARSVITPKQIKDFVSMDVITFFENLSYFFSLIIVVLFRIPTLLRGGIEVWGRVLPVTRGKT